ncbi:MAG: V-type ATPase subunit [Syntrophales bacterium]|nr:V-type ATPase subunit [Syntrophales bacterium]
MKQYADREYLHTRIYAMRGRLLRLRDYSSLLREHELLSEKTDDLQQSMLAEKEKIFRDQVGDVVKLAEATGYHDPLFLAFLRRYEILNMKLLLAKAFGRETFEQWYDIGRYSILDRSLIGENLSLELMERTLKDTYLGGIFEGTKNYERLLIRLDGLTITNMLNCADKLDPDDGIYLREILFMRAAVLITIWKWRLSVNYGWDDTRIALYVEPFKDLMGRELPNYITLVEEILQSGMEDLKKHKGSTPDTGEIENHLETWYYRWMQSVFYRDFHSICCVAAYLWLLGLQIRNIFSIVEGLRFRLPHDSILGRIISDP